MIITTQGCLDALPIGSVVMALWDKGPLHYVFQRYSNGWFGMLSDSGPLFPLGAIGKPNACIVLWDARLELILKTEGQRDAKNALAAL